MAVSLVGNRDLTVESIEWKRPQVPSARCSRSSSFTQGWEPTAGVLAAFKSSRIRLGSSEYVPQNAIADDRVWPSLQKALPKSFDLVLGKHKPVHMLQL